MPSVSEQVRTYIDARPMLRAALAQGIINYSALVRQIMDETNLTSRDAVLTACRRYKAAPDESADRAVRHALRESRLEMRTHVAMLAYHASWPLVRRLATALEGLGDGERVHVFHGWEDVTVVADEALLTELKKRLKEEPVDEREGLVELNLRSDEAAVPGFLAAATAALAQRGINVIDAASCRSDHLFLIEESDLAGAIDAIDATRR